MAFDLNPYKIAAGTKPYKTEFDLLVDRIQLGLNTNLADIEALQSQVGGNANDSVGDLRLSSRTLDADKYLGPIPYPSGLTGLSKTTYSALYGTPGFSGSDSALWEVQSSTTTNDITSLVWTGVAFLAFAGASTVRYSLDGTTWQNTVTELAGTPPNQTVNAAAASSTVAGTVIVVGPENYVSKSTNHGITFSTISIGAFSHTFDIKDVKEVYGIFYATGTRADGYSMFMYSVDEGDTWTVTQQGILGLYNSVNFDGTTYIILAGTRDNTASTLRSSDAFATYSSVGIHSGVFVYNDVIHVGGVWVVCGSNGVIRYSTNNGEAWTTVSTTATSTLNFCRYDSYNNNFIFGGEPQDGAVLLHTWVSGDPSATPQVTGASLALNDYTENGIGTSVVVGNGGAIYTFEPYSGDFSLSTAVNITDNTYAVSSVSYLVDSFIALARNASDILIYSRDSAGIWTLENTVATGITAWTAKIFYDTDSTKYILCVGDAAASEFKIFTSNSLNGTFTQKLSKSGSGIVPSPTLNCTIGNGIFVATAAESTAIAGGGKIWVSSDGGETIAEYTDATGSAAYPNGRRVSVKYYGGYFIIPIQGDGTFLYSATGAESSWVSVIPAGASSSGTCDIGYIGDTYYYLNTTDSTSYWKSTDITNLGTANSMASGSVYIGTGTTVKFMSILSANGAMMGRFNISSAGEFTAYSTNGENWDYIPGNVDLGLNKSGTNTNNVYNEGIPFLVSDDDFVLSDYTPKTVATTFSAPWPPQFAAPSNNYGVYIRYEP